MTSTERSRRSRLDPNLRRELDAIRERAIEQIREEQSRPLFELATDEDWKRLLLSDEEWYAPLSDEQRAAVNAALADAAVFLKR
ncbi:MAG: hypothetical protein ACLQF1_17015 [Methyloceanibacter sp.]|jgi:hypothetical protein